MRQLRKTIPAVLAACALALGPVAAGATADRVRGSVRLFTPSHDLTMTVYHYGEDQWTELNPAIYLKARGTRFEIDVRRPDFRHPVRARVHIGGIDREIPARYLDGWTGLRRAFVTTWKRTDGTTISRRTRTWCPNGGQTSRLSPASATETAFTTGCGSHPFTKGFRWGVDRGWARSLQDQVVPPPATPDDELILVFSLRRAYAQIFGIPERGRTLRFHVKVKHVYDEGGNVAPEPAGRGLRYGSASSATHSPAPPAATGPRANPPRGSLPDLIALPSFGIATRSASGKDFLDFAATVYNGGPGPLVAEGFRRGSKPVMDAYQFFYDHHQDVVATAKVGTMGYDRRDSHQHWHFRDFAVYDLVNRAEERVRTSGKEAFCLAPTDAIDLLARGSVPDPGNGDLGTACGEASSIWVREVLAAGWGDTYTQQRAGQSINITGLRNGTYWLRVTANPDRRLYEASMRNNVALRRVVIGGTPGDRTVRVPAHGLIDSEATFGCCGE